MERKIQKIDK